MIEKIVYEDNSYRVYEYDSLDRLAGEQHFDSSDALLYSASYSYDLAGKRTQTVINNVTHSYTLAQTGDRLASWGVNGENTVTYDSAGNVLGVYDANGQPLPSSGIGNRYLFQGREYSWETSDGRRSNGARKW